MSNETPMQVLDTILGVNLLAVQAAEVAFERTKLHLADYRVTVMGEGNSIFVTFTDKDASLRGRGSPGMRPGYQVELDRTSLHVLKASFIR